MYSLFSISNIELSGFERSVIVSGYPFKEVIDTDADNFEDKLVEIYSYLSDIEDPEIVAENPDISRAMRLAPVGGGHNNFLKGCIVQFNLQAPLYFWKQIQRYHFLEIVSSQSSMHMLGRLDVINFFHPALLETVSVREFVNAIEDWKSESDPQLKIDKFSLVNALMPAGFSYTAGISTNALQLLTIYNQRKAHKLREWHLFCDAIKTIPFLNAIIKKQESNK